VRVPIWVPYWAPIIVDIAHRFEEPPELVTALVWKESDGRAHAYRYEDGFFDRYLAGKREWTRCLLPGALETWKRRASASYGLAQIMFPTAVQHGLPIDAEPELLFQPSLSLEYGLRHLRWCRQRAGGDTLGALRGYNGGFPHGEYPARVIAYAEDVLARSALINASF